MIPEPCPVPDRIDNICYVSRKTAITSGVFMSEYQDYDFHSKKTVKQDQLTY